MLKKIGFHFKDRCRRQYPIRFSDQTKVKHEFISPAMKAAFRRLANSLSGLIIFVFLVLIHIALVGADAFDSLTVHNEVNGRWPLFDCPQCMDKKDQVHPNSMAAGNHQVEKVVPTAKGQALADEYGIKFFETSAKTNLNVEEVFFSIGRDIKQRLAETDTKAELQPQTIKINQQG